MNDRFKFRVWDKLDEEYYDENCFQMQIESSGDLFIIGVGNDGEDCFWETDNTVVEQCTGLKDKNGKLIYEGDIVKAFGFKDYYKLVCRFRDSSFCLDHIDGSPYNFAHSVSPVEVIGNIHENADLLEI